MKTEQNIIKKQNNKLFKENNVTIINTVWSRDKIK